MPEVSEPLTLVPEGTDSKANLNGVNKNSTPKDSVNGTRTHPFDPNLNGVNKNSTPKDSVNGTRTHPFDPNFTQNVLNCTGPKTSPRMRKVMTSLIQHIHDFARENEITVEEWMAGVEFINEAGRSSNDRRNETQLLCDVIGLESLVDEITYKLVSEGEIAPTATSVLGPFWRADAPKREMGTSTAHNMPDGDHTYIQGEVKDYLTGKPIEGAVLDVWQAAPNGLYEQQDPNQVDFNLRGRFTTGQDGRYSFYCLRPTPYPIFGGGQAGKLLKLLDRHPMRPAHIHFFITAPNYRPLVTQIFDRIDKNLDNDAVFGVKESLIADFVPRKNDPKAQSELAYDFQLATLEEAKTKSVAGTTEESRSHGAAKVAGGMSGWF